MNRCFCTGGEPPPGKWLLGIRVTDDKGAKLRYRDAAGRCGTLLVYGLGLNIPILTAIRQVRSLADVARGEEPEWEWDSQLQLREPGRFRAAALSILCALLLSVTQTEIRALPELPPNKGELSVEEFSQNFVALQRYYESGGNVYIFNGDMRKMSVMLPYTLDDAGRWTASDRWVGAGGNSLDWRFNGAPPELALHTDADGTVTGVTLSFDEVWTAGKNDEASRRGRIIGKQIFLMRIVLQAFGGAQPENRYPLSGWRSVQDISANGWRQDYSFVHKNIAVDYDVEFSGCAPAENGAPQLEETAGAEKCAVSYTFAIQRHETPGRIFS